MDVRDGKVDAGEFMDINPRIEALIKKFDRAGIPLGVITDVQGFSLAYNCAYAPILDSDRAVAYRRIAELTSIENLCDE